MYTISIIIDDVIDALKAAIQPFVGSTQIVRGQSNRTPMPNNPCVVLTELLSVDLSVPRTEYQNIAETATVTGPTRIDIQVDFYDGLSGEYCKLIQMMFRTGIGFDSFPATIKPLYCSDGVQSPLITGEQQWESRWTLTASLQYNPVVTLPQQSADSLNMHFTNQADKL